MKSAVRHKAVASVLLIGAGIIIANPVRPSLPEVQTPATELTTNESVFFNPPGISADHEVLAPGSWALGGSGAGGDVGQLPMLDDFDPLPLPINVFGDPPESPPMIAGDEPTDSDDE
ncbi:hypothetical protein A5707_15160 [Mycobacterium kyorinense]|uniref:Uncharacterized protein n=1 Tax=Mycobacterium kyorinense TaxID=487514 RepID=A0A1A2ZNA2_9MYCO|nr:hypothetical protein [Mycobacterium kyorinense]OBI50556.1 hypothetical protein A5707_15160 [Mycobacterium kyorinense]